MVTISGEGVHVIVSLGYLPFREWKKSESGRDFYIFVKPVLRWSILYLSRLGLEYYQILENLAKSQVSASLSSHRGCFRLNIPRISQHLYPFSTAVNFQTLKLFNLEVVSSQTFWIVLLVVRKRKTFSFWRNFCCEPSEQRLFVCSFLIPLYLLKSFLGIFFVFSKAWWYSGVSKFRLFRPNF